MEGRKATNPDRNVAEDPGRLFLGRKKNRQINYLTGLKVRNVTLRKILQKHLKM